MTELGLAAQLEQSRASWRRSRQDVSARRDHLARLGAALKRHEVALLQAVDADFGGRSHDETRLLELFPLHDQIRHARRHLGRWMRRQRVASSWFLWPASAFWQYQPVGVVGILGAWNYPLLLTLGPLVDALAAGNHAMLKPSEWAPKTAQLLTTLMNEVFASDQVRVVIGDATAAAAFAELPFDHLFFTGSTRVGHQVMRAAAKHLTPVTLELGGKSPAIIHASYSLSVAAQRIMTGKLFNAGQTCVAPDYVLLPRGAESAFAEAARKVVQDLYPELVTNPDYTRMISPAHQQRLRDLVAEAEAGGARVVSLGPAAATGPSQYMPPTLLFAVPATARILTEEIFGPLLPVISYDHLAEAVDYVESRPRPLALYYFDHNKSRQDQLLAQTLSGGVTFNDCIFHLAQHNLPFGGIGASGMGHYHGHDGFITFSKKRPVMRQAQWASTSLLHAPWAPRRGLLRLLLKLAAR